MTTASARVDEAIRHPAAGTWDIDPTHTSVSFVVRHLMITNVRGRFAGFSGVIHVGDTPEESSVEIDIDASSIDTDLPDRDEHLRSADFLDVERHPTIRFRSVRVRPAGGDRFVADGELTIRGVTKSIALEGKYEGAVADPWGNTRAAASASAEIDREDFGLTWNQALEAGGVLVGKTVRIEIEVEAIAQAESAAA